MTTLADLKTLLAEKRFDQVEAAFREALLDAVANAEGLLAVCRALARVPAQKNRLQSMSTAADAALKGASGPQAARLRWELLKEAVKAGATPTTADGFHRLFESALAGAYPGCASLQSLLGHFKVREATTPLDGMARLEKVEKWLPFEPGKVFAMAGRGPGKVVETNFQLDAVRIDFEKAKGISIPIGVAAKGLVPLPEGHFLREKLVDPAGLAARAEADPASALKHLLGSSGKPLTVSEVKEAFAGVVPEERWSSFWTAARKHPNVVVHGAGKNAPVEWTATAEAAEDKLLAKFEKSTLVEQVDFFRKHGKRSADLAAKLARFLAEEARRCVESDPAGAFEIGVVVEGTPGVTLGFDLDALVPERAVPFLAKISDRVSRERALEIHARRFPAANPALLAAWLLQEEDVRTLDAVDRRLRESDPAGREELVDRLLKNPRQGPRAFYWWAQKAAEDEAARARLTGAVLSRLLDAVGWAELSPVRTKMKEMFDRTGLAAQWLVKQATVDEARAFLEALHRHHDLELHRVRALISAAEMRFPELRRKAEEETFFATEEAIEAKRQELDQILKVEIPENTKGIQQAAQEGDLSENFEYKARRDKQQLLSARAGQIQSQLSLARPLDPTAIDASEVRPGTRVTLRSGAGERSLTLLGPWDSAPERGVYSYLSDLGKALLGKRPGDAAVLLGEEVVVERVEVWR